MTKTKAEYEKLFEDLMKYTNFTSVSQIKTKQDLRDFMGEVRDDAAKRGLKTKDQNKFFATKLLFEMENARERIMEHPIVAARKIPTKKEEVLLSSKKFKFYADARKAGLTAVNVDGIVVFKSGVIRKSADGKKQKMQVVYRDMKGRFAKKPMPKQV